MGDVAGFPRWREHLGALPAGGRFVNTASITGTRNAKTVGNGNRCQHGPSRGLSSNTAMPGSHAQKSAVNVEITHAISMKDTPNFPDETLTSAATATPSRRPGCTIWNWIWPTRQEVVRKQKDAITRNAWGCYQQYLGASAATRSAALSASVT